MGAPAGLLRHDGSAKPAFDALVGLVKNEWWLPATQMRTDQDGRVQVRGFAGDYRVSHASGTASVHLDRGATAHLRAALE